MTTTTRAVRARFSDRALQVKPSLRPAPATVRYSFLLFVFTFPFEFLQMPYVTGGHFSLANLTGLTFFAFYLFHLRVPFNKRIPSIPPAMGWFFCYVLAYLLSGVLIDDEFTRGFFIRLTTVIQLLVFFWCASDLLQDQRLAKGCLLSFSLAAVILALGTLLNVPGFVTELGQRTAALDMNPNRVAGLMVAATIILIGLSLHENHWSLKRKGFVLGLTLPLVLLLVSTGSRAGIGGLIIGMAIFFFARGGLKRKVTASLLGAAGIAVVVAFAVSDPVASRRWTLFLETGHTAGRDAIWEHAVEMIAERPIFGWGRAAFDELGFRLGLMGNRDAHNFLLYLLLEVGVIGTVPFLVGVFLCVLAAWKARKGSLGILPLALVISLLSMMMTHSGLTAKSFWLFLALSLGAAAAVGQRVRIRPNAVSSRDFRIPHREPLVHQ